MDLLRDSIGIKKATGGRPWWVSGLAGTLQAGPLTFKATLSIALPRLLRGKLPNRFSFLLDEIVPRFQKLKNEEDRNSPKLEKVVNRLFFSI